MLRSGQEFVALIMSSSKADRVRALSSEAPASVWMKVIHEFPGLIRFVAFNRSLPDEVLIELAESASAEVREAVANRSRLPEQVQRRLARDACSRVRLALVRKSMLSDDLLADLARDTDSEIARFVRREIDARVRKQLRAADLEKEKGLRPFGKGFKPIQSAAEFERLLHSDQQDEYLSAAHSIASFDVWMDIAKSYPELKEWVVLNKTVGADVLAALASDEDENIRAAVARKSKAGSDTLDHLGRDRTACVRLAVARNRKTSSACLNDLKDDLDAEVRSAAIANLQRRHGERL
ncbi:hypothetical protein KPL74_18940 [Bacillus sp. NP157]|nr:hypothetical protein KPL74_18940 [Bacillus sp. NP157]